jgi:heavy metal translocating P-type ATPase
MSSQPAVEREVILDIEGMTCVSCVDRLEKVLSRQPAVSEARVSLAARTAAVRSTLTDAAPLVAAVKKAGYQARLHDQPTSMSSEVRDYKRRLAVAAFCSFDVLVFSLVAAPGSRASALAAWLFTTPVQFYSGWPFLRGALRAARRGTYTMDTLVSLGSLAAYLFSVGAMLTRAHHAYFDTSAMIITLILLGRVLEGTARMKAGNAARTLLERQPKQATRIDRGREHLVPVEELKAGDRVVVRPGEHFPADGTVVLGSSTADLSMLTGESVPVDVGPGDDAVGASLNGHGRLVVELTGVGPDTKLAQIVRLLEITQASKAPIQRLADRIVAEFVPRVLFLSLVAFAYQLLLGSGGFEAAFLRAAAVLLVACPCSLGLATPVAIMAGSGRAAELGILFKGGEVFEAARRIDTVLVDKTGTLTEGAMRLTEIVAPEMSEEELLGLAAAAESGSEHPIGRCVFQAAIERGVSVPSATGHRAEPGAGIEALVRGVRVRVGRPAGLPETMAAKAQELAESGLTVFGVWREEEAVGLLGARDTVKPGAAEAVRRLRQWGWQVALVSGDRRAAVEAVARETGIDSVVAEVFPQEKVEEVRRLQQEGRRVAFVGDGINDAPALAQADVGIALGTGTDVAMEAGDVLIMGGDVTLVADALGLARRTFWVIAQNLGWAFAYNLLMIPLAVAGKVSPLVAAAAMAGSSVTVVGNALRLLGYGTRRPTVDSPAVDTTTLEAGPPPVDEHPIDPGPTPEPDGRAEVQTEGDSGVKLRVSVSPDDGRLGTVAREDARKIARGLSSLFDQQWEI